MTEPTNAPNDEQAAHEDQIEDQEDLELQGEQAGEITGGDASMYQWIKAS